MDSHIHITVKKCRNEVQYIKKGLISAIFGTLRLELTHLKSKCDTLEILLPGNHKICIRRGALNILLKKLTNSTIA